MRKSTKNICVISGVLFGLAVLYLAGAAILPSVGLEYRFWVESLGKCLCMLVLPLWLLGAGVWKLWQCFQGNASGRWLVRLLGCGAGGLYLVWCYFGMLMILFGTNEDHYLGGGLVAVVTESFPKPTGYAVYERVGVFFRREASLTPEAVTEYLSEKYKRNFYPIWEGGEIFYVDADREAVRVKVEFCRGKLCENYPQALADYYLEEGYRKLGLNWDSCFLGTGAGEEHFCLNLDREGDLGDFGADLYRLMQYAGEQDPLLEKYDVFVYFSSDEYEGKWAKEGFGRTKCWEDPYFKEYQEDGAKVTQAVKRGLASIRLQAARENLLQENIGAVSAAAPSPTPEPTVREMAEAEYPGQCAAAQAIWEAELKACGYGYEPGFNAKGNLVIWLGKLPADKLCSDTEESDYYLTYDRESKNGNCYLFVLSEVPEGNGLNDACLREFYACEKDTLQVAAGEKTSWEQRGCKAYRELTGE